MHVNGAHPRQARFQQRRGLAGVLAQHRHFPQADLGPGHALGVVARTVDDQDVLKQRRRPRHIARLARCNRQIELHRGAAVRIMQRHKQRQTVLEFVAPGRDALVEEGHLCLSVQQPGTR